MIRKILVNFPERLAPITIKSNIDTKNEFPSLSRVNGDISKTYVTYLLTDALLVANTCCRI